LLRRDQDSNIKVVAMRKFSLIIITGLFFICSAFTPASQLGFVNDGPGAAKMETQSNGKVKLMAGTEVMASKWMKMQDGFWYLTDDQGYVLTGWQYKDGNTYYLTETATDGHLMGSLWTGGATPDGRETDGEGKLIGELGCRPNVYHHDCVEVSIPEQQVYVYKGELLIYQTACVTGKTSNESDTPVGDYKLQAKVPDKTLKGKNKDGSEYESFVHYWMPFNYSYGLHDAPWRGAFGGTIYQNSGSHGCVNLPSKAAAAIWDLVYVGMPVHVHQ